MEYPRRVNEAQRLSCCDGCEISEDFHDCECYMACEEYAKIENAMIAKDDHAEWDPGSLFNAKD